MSDILIVSLSEDGCAVKASGRSEIRVSAGVCPSGGGLSEGAKLDTLAALPDSASPWFNSTKKVGHIPHIVGGTAEKMGVARSFGERSATAPTAPGPRRSSPAGAACGQPSYPAAIGSCATAGATLTTGSS